MWIVAAEIKVEERLAKLADFRGSFTTAADTRVDALEVYCRYCRRLYESVAGADCEAQVDNRHLIGGASQSAKRIIPTPSPNTRALPAPVIRRRGIGAYVSGVPPARTVDRHAHLPSRGGISAGVTHLFTDLQFTAVAGILAAALTWIGSASLVVVLDSDQARDASATAPYGPPRESSTAVPTPGGAYCATSSGCS
ncbi:hypothetical protein PV371_36350 [Streptomyces sp. TX20-6-3]|uniref:hypothetical protein n=1 Tax=Streptomyces sp. TX20-6-3 TaxID=3028705 RepID=UPI0029B517F9|nr:hypothetical protein [Streptomyces sp. TX20-6-3]MDX2565100.1 hypothetical protein [Streptomyces sp. TX20-6-3]